MFDASLVDSSILAAVQDLKFLPGIGLIAIIDSQKGDYRNLAIAYMLARDITLNAKTLELDTDVLKIIVNRLIKDARDMALVKHLVTANIDNMKQILAQIEKGILLAEFNQRYLIKFLAEGPSPRKTCSIFMRVKRSRNVSDSSNARSATFAPEISKCRPADCLVPS